MSIVCLCGSTRFKKAFEEAALDEALKGNIVLSVACFAHHDKISITEGQRALLNKLHLQKIDLADEVLIINVGGYIGETTINELVYARKIGKNVRFLY